MERWVGDEQREHLVDERVRFEFMDGLRGLAACSVVLFHFAGRLNIPHILAHGWLAVDFFFILSGFVITHAYEDRRKNGLSLRQFALQRFIRLYPMIFFGMMLGLLTPLPDIDFRSEYMTNFLLVPVPSASGRANVFPLNGPAWSLFFEVIANIVFAMTLYRLEALKIIFIYIFSAVICLLIAMYYDTMALGHTNETFVAGLPRVMVSTSSGILLYRLRLRGLLRFIKIPAWAICLTLATIFSMPDLQSGEGILSWLTIIVVMPLLIAASTNHVPNGHYDRINGLGRDLSYPLYLIHRPLEYFLIPFIDDNPILKVVALTLGFVTCLALSYLVFRYYDRPVRRWLAAKISQPAPIPRTPYKVGN